MGMALINDGLPTTNRPEMEDFVRRGEEVAKGQRVKGLAFRRVSREGKPDADAFQVILEDGRSLVFFSPVAYAITEAPRELPVSGEG